MSTIKLRFNTESALDKSMLPWRVVVDGVEHLAQRVIFATDAYTTHDEVAPGRFKWHVTCVGEPAWHGTVCTIR
jgi:hypothetical protein